MTVALAKGNQGLVWRTFPQEKKNLIFKETKNKEVYSDLSYLSPYKPLFSEDKKKFPIFTNREFKKRNYKENISFRKVIFSYIRFLRFFKSTKIPIIVPKKPDSPRFSQVYF